MTETELVVRAVTQRVLGKLEAIRACVAPMSPDDEAEAVRILVSEYVDRGAITAAEACEIQETIRGRVA